MSGIKKFQTLKARLTSLRRILAQTYYMKEMKEATKETLCDKPKPLFSPYVERCTNLAQEPHTCPYLSDIEDDDETLCVCCERCENECYDDI